MVYVILIIGAVAGIPWFLYHKNIINLKILKVVYVGSGTLVLLIFVAVFVSVYKICCGDLPDVLDECPMCRHEIHGFSTCNHKYTCSQCKHIHLNDTCGVLESKFVRKEQYCEKEPIKETYTVEEDVTKYREESKQVYKDVQRTRPVMKSVQKSRTVPKTVYYDEPYTDYEYRQETQYTSSLQCGYQVVTVSYPVTRYRSVPHYTLEIEWYTGEEQVLETYTERALVTETEKIPYIVRENVTKTRITGYHDVTKYRNIYENVACQCTDISQNCNCSRSSCVCAMHKKLRIQFQ